MSAQEDFFDAFPNTWMEFIMTYQYIPKKDYDLTMYNNAQNHIKALGDKITLINDSLFIVENYSILRLVESGMLMLQII